MLDDFEQLADQVIMAGDPAFRRKWLSEEAQGKWHIATASVEAAAGIIPVTLTVSVYSFERLVDATLFRLKFK